MTMRWRKPPRTIAAAACSSDQSGRGEHEVGGQVVGDELGVRVLAVADREQDVALGDDARARRLGIDDDRGADAALGHRRAPPGAACGPAPPSAPSCSCHPAPASRPSPRDRLQRSPQCLPGRPDARGRRKRSSRAATRQIGPGGQVIHLAHSRVSLTCPCNAPPPSASAPACSRTRSRSSSSEYAADLSLDDIARRVASSRRQLQRAYAEIGDTTFREHLTRVRMERAAELLGRAAPDGARGRAPRRLPPAGPVRQGVPPPPRRRAVGLPRAARVTRRARSPPERRGRLRAPGEPRRRLRRALRSCRVHRMPRAHGARRGHGREPRRCRRCWRIGADRVGARHRARPADRLVPGAGVRRRPGRSTRCGTSC